MIFDRTPYIRRRTSCIAHPPQNKQREKRRHQRALGVVHEVLIPASTFRFNWSANLCVSTVQNVLEDQTRLCKRQVAILNEWQLAERRYPAHGGRRLAR